MRKRPSPQPTPREMEILTLVAQGLSMGSIARMLGISEKTAQAHRYNFMSKLDLHNTAQVTAYAINKGIVTAEKILEASR